MSQQKSEIKMDQEPDQANKYENDYWRIKEYVDDMIMQDRE